MEVGIAADKKCKLKMRLAPLTLSLTRLKYMHCIIC